ncbi:MAG: maleylpyruvate isomerase family mycothiol-dependent enzyme [Actinomycetota bacterium]
MARQPLAFDTYLGHLVAEAARFDAAIASAPPDVRVPACPDWDRGELRDHQAGVLAFWRRQLADDASPQTGPVADGVEQDAARSVEALAADMAARLTALGPDRPCWNWSGERQVSGWVARRMAQEISVHRVDAESIAGPAAPIADEMAADGIDELLDVFVDARPGMPVAGGVVTELFDEQRRAVLTPEGAVRTEAEPTARLTGTASDVLLALWGRTNDASWTGDDRAAPIWADLAEFE